MRRALVIGVIVLLVLALLYPLALAVVALSSPPPGAVGINLVRPCPDTPNCVSSLARERPDAQVLPLYYTGEMFIAQALLIDAIEEQPGAVVLVAQDGYIHAERRSGWLRFVNDMEFFFRDDVKEVHVRSAARLGYSDGGGNRRAVERIRQAFNEKMR